MSIPADFSTTNISGRFILNKTLTDGDKTDKILTLQGVGWLKRRAISIGTVTLYVNHGKNDAGVETIVIEQTISGGIPGTTESRTLDWTERETNDKLFGPVVGKSRRVKVEDLDIDFLKQHWTPDSLESGLIHSYVESDTPKSGTTWIGEQAWGIQEIQVNGEASRRYSRNVKFTGPGAEEIEVLMVYDYLGPLA